MCTQITIKKLFIKIDLFTNMMKLHNLFLLYCFVFIANNNAVRCNANMGYTLDVFNEIKAVIIA